MKTTVKAKKKTIKELQWDTFVTDITRFLKKKHVGIQYGGVACEQPFIDLKEGTFSIIQTDPTGNYKCTNQMCYFSLQNFKSGHNSLQQAVSDLADNLNLIVSRKVTYRFAKP